MTSVLVAVLKIVLIANMFVGKVDDDVQSHRIFASMCLCVFEYILHIRLCCHELDILELFLVEQLCHVRFASCHARKPQMMCIMSCGSLR